MAKKSVRHYQPIWEDLKERYTMGTSLLVECSPKLRSRIKKGVMKEKSELEPDDFWRSSTILKKQDVDLGIIFYLEEKKES